MNFSLMNFSWTREPESWDIADGKLRVVTCPHLPELKKKGKRENHEASL